MYLITLVFVGLVAGVMAAVVMRRSSVGVVRFILIGIVGSLVGALVFGELGWHVPLAGMARATAIALVGAAALLWLTWFFTGSRKPQ